MGAKLQLVINKDKGLDMSALLKPTDSIVIHSLAEVIYYPKLHEYFNEGEPSSLYTWTYQNLPIAFYRRPAELKDDFRFADLTIKSPRNMRVGYIELPRTEYQHFCDEVRKVFHIHSINLKKEWSLVHSYENGAHQWRTFERFLEDRRKVIPFTGPVPV